MANEIQRVKNAIALNEAVIFIGSGVSLYTTNGEQEVAHWKGLLRNGLQQCHQLGRLSDEDLEHLNNTFSSNTAENDDYLLVADRIKSSLGEENDLYEAWLIETIGQLSVKKPELIEAIGEMGCPIVTTNYDSLLEDVLEKKPFTWKQHETNNGVLHVYGHFEEPDSVIFSSDDYWQIRENESIRLKLRVLLQSKTLIFIGYGAGMSDPSFFNILKWISDIFDDKPPLFYKLVQSRENRRLDHSSDVLFLENIKEIQYGTTAEDLLSLIRSLKSFTSIIRESISFGERRERIRKKYLNYLIDEYGHVSIFGYANNNMNLPLESVYVELKFDPTHPSIKAMKTLEVNEEFKRKLLSSGFFTDIQRRQLNRAIIERNAFNAETIYRDFMVEQWLNVLLSNRNIFSETEAIAIRNKVNRLKQNIMEKNSFTEAKQYRIQQVYNELKHFVILGHPGSGKTTLSKWLVMNMAKQCLEEENMLFDRSSFVQAKIPILIPIWKYVDQMKQNENEEKKSLVQFICQNVTFDSACFDDEERRDLSMLMIESLLQGNVLIIFEGLDEVPAHIDRSDLMKEINSLLERGIDYDIRSNKLTYSIYEQKEINNIRDPNLGNRFIITSRIEGNYFEEINFFIPRLTIENMSNDALKLFCRSYMECIREVSIQSGKVGKEHNPDQLYNDISQNKDIFQLAINPQLASVIAAMYNQYEDQLPERRIDLYEKAIEKMIERLITSSNHSAADYTSEGVTLNETMIWSILQEIAEYLHSKVEGLSEKILKQIIRRSLIDYRQQSTMNVEDLISKLVNIFKYQAGLLSEFGHNSFRFIHRTFQEYLAAKSIIYSNGSERSEEIIYENIISKIGIPNWRVPLSMTFGILSKSVQHTALFDNIITRLLTHGSISSNTQFSTLLVPFVIIDSLNDMHFSSTDIEHRLIRNLANMLLSDYQNLHGFSRLKEHQDLIHSYFFKLKGKYDEPLADWLTEKLEHVENVAPCANIIHQLKWYTPKFHQIFLKSLHNDSAIWNWPVDSLLRSYSTEIKYNAILRRLKFKRTLIKNPTIVQHIIKNQDWLCLIIALYGGYKNHNTPTTISEYYEIAQFLGLSDNERTPFLFYYQNIWGKEDAVYSMAVHLDTFKPKIHWNEKATFDINEIYKESFLTEKILQLLIEEKSTTELKGELRKQINSEELSVGEKTEVLIALIILGDFDLTRIILNEREEIFLRNRIEQLICTLKDPIARYSSQITNYLSVIYSDMKANRSKYNLHFSDYCRIYLSLIANSGGQPVDTKMLAEDMDHFENRCSLYAEFFASKFTGYTEDVPYSIAVLLDTCICSSKSDQMIGSLLKISEAVQVYKPVRTYPWPLDIFTFQFHDENDIPIALFNCLENINTNLAFAVQGICDVLFKEGYFTRNPQLIPLVILLYFGIMSKYFYGMEIYKKWIPELNEKTNIREFLSENIQAMYNPYYKSRALYQLAQFDDEQSYELLNASFTLTKDIPEAVFKFQVLEKIFSIVHYKNVEQKLFIQQIVDELALTFEQIEDPYDRVIASIRLSFYGSKEFRKQCLEHALQVLAKINKNDDKIKLMIKLKPLICLYDDLQIKLNDIVGSLKNQACQYFVNSQYGRILYTEKLPVDTSNLRMDVNDKQKEDYTELQALFLLIAQLNDMKSIIGGTESIDRLWLNLFKDPANQSNVEKILEIGLKNELFLTPQVAIILDEIVREGKEDLISILFPYIIKPSNEVLPVVQRWFTDYDNNSIKNLAALLLVEAKHIFEAAVDTITDLLNSDNDQMRYRAQRVFQHPERDVKEPSKRISVIGTKTLMKILENIQVKDHPLRVRTYLNSFFYDLQWDDPVIFQNLHEKLTHLPEENPNGERRMYFFNRMQFMNDVTWNALMQTLQTPQLPSYVEKLLQSILILTQHNQITEENWTEFGTVLSLVDTSQFREQLYFNRTDVERMQVILDEICALTNISDETYFEILESKVLSELTVRVQDLAQNNSREIKHLGRCNFFASRELNQTVLNMLNNLSINTVIMENLIQWLIQKMVNFKDVDDAWVPLMMCDSLLSLVSACVQKEDYLYRKITNSSNFNKGQMIKLLEKILNHHPCFLARGNAFILLSAMDQSDHKVIVNAMNTLLDENLVKEYSMIGIPLIQLSPNEFLDDLLQSLKNESAVKAYEILKMFTQFVLSEKIDANGKSKIINYLANEIGQLKSKKPVNYYYIDIKIPFTTTLENELYKAWIKIQGLSGKTQYSINADTSKSS